MVRFRICDGSLANRVVEGTQSNVLCVEPSSFGEQTPDHLERIKAGALEFLKSNDRKFDAILLKQMIHHIPVDSRDDLANRLYEACNANAKVLVLTMPPTIEFPIFEAANQAFQKESDTLRSNCGAFISSRI